MASTTSLDTVGPKAQSVILGSNADEDHLPPGTLRRRGRRGRCRRHSPLSPQSEATRKASAIIPFSRDADFVERAEIFHKQQQSFAVPGSRTALVGLGGVGRGTGHRIPGFSGFIPMTSTDADALLQKKMGSQEDNQEMAKLAAMLDYMPLAMIQAAAYISHRKPRYSVQQYLRDFQKSEDRRTALLNCEEGQLRRDWEAKNSILTTWQISFNYIRQNRPSAANLLALMSFYDRQGIPEHLIRQSNRNPGQEMNSTTETEEKSTYEGGSEEDATSQSSVDVAFDDDVHALREQSFISVSPDGKTFEIHALVQLATREWLSSNKELEIWKQEFFKSLYEHCPPVEFENWAKWQILFPHVQSVLAHVSSDEQSISQRWRASLLLKASQYAQEVGNLRDAGIMATEAFNVYEKLGSEQFGRLLSMRRMSSVFIMKGQFKAAEELELQLLELHMKLLGPTNFATSRNKRSLAIVYWSQGRWEASEKLELEVLEVFKDRLGVEHPDKLNTMANLAGTYSKQGKWNAAGEIEIKVLDTMRQVYGVNHPDTLDVMASLALTYMRQGRFLDALELGLQALEARKRTLGATHPDTLASMAHVGTINRHLGKLDSAEELYVKVIEEITKKLGDEHPIVLSRVANLAVIYKDKGQINEAEKVHLRVLHARLKVLGNGHPETLSSKAYLAEIYRIQAKWSAAEELGNEAFEAQQKNLGEKHPETLMSKYGLAHTWKGQGRDLKALETVREFVKESEPILGSGHPDYVAAVKTLAVWEAEQADVSILYIT